MSDLAETTRRRAAPRREPEQRRLATGPSPANMAPSLSKLFQPAGAGYFSFCPADTWQPEVNLYEEDHAYYVCVNLAGVEKDKIEVTVVENRVNVRGKRAVPQRPTDEQMQPGGQRVRVHLMEIDHGSFCREVELPANADRLHISAAYRNGFLWVELPKL